MVQRQHTLRYSPSQLLPRDGIVAGSMVGMRMANLSCRGGGRIRAGPDTQLYLHRATSRNYRIRPLARAADQPQLDRAKAWTPQKDRHRRKAVHARVHSLT